MYSEIRKEQHEAVKAVSAREANDSEQSAKRIVLASKGCPKCHRLMKSAVIQGKTTWICLYCKKK